MSQKNREKLHLIYGIVLSAIIVLLGVCLIVSCVSIYRSGDRPFTPESISAQFKKILIPSILCDLGVVGGIVISLAFPLGDKRERPSADQKDTVRKLRKRLASYESGSYEAEKIAGKRSIVGLFCALMCVFSAVPVLIHLLNFSNFTSDINGSVVSLALTALPCSALAFAIGVIYSFYSKYSYEREISELKKELTEAVKSGAEAKPTEEAVKNNKTATVVFRVVIFTVAVAFIVLGIMNGGMSDVLEKAIKICTECIGLG